MACGPASGWRWSPDEHRCRAPRKTGSASPRATTRARSPRSAPAAGTTRSRRSIIQAAFELGLEQHRVAKLSGIGCSSKTPAYFLGRSHAFNAVHGRMPSIATERPSSRTASLDPSRRLGRWGQRLDRARPVLPSHPPQRAGRLRHREQRGLRTHEGPVLRDRRRRHQGEGGPGERAHADRSRAVAIELGCGFVARSFSGDPKQLRPILKAAFSHRGTVVLDVISPVRHLSTTTKDRRRAT